MTKFQLANLLFSPLDGRIQFVKGITFKSILSIEKEDGSGKRYNVHGINKLGQKHSVFVETLD